MANGEMLAELRRMAEGSDLSSEAASRLTLSALAEVYRNTQTQVQAVTGLQECFQGLNNVMDSIQKDLIELRSDVSAVKQSYKEIQENPVVAFGKHIKTHPRMAILYLIIATVFITWLPYINLVRLGLLWAGVPPAIVDLITPSIGGQ